MDLEKKLSALAADLEAIQTSANQAKKPAVRIKLDEELRCASI